MTKSIFFVIFIFIFFIMMYLGEGCNVLKPVPTPTLTPTVTFTPTITPTLTPTQDPKMYLIIPGTGLANVLINKTNLSDVEKWLGDSGSKSTEKGYIKLSYATPKISFWFSSDKQVLKSILIEDGSYKTSERIGVDSSILDVRSMYDKGVLDSNKGVYFCDDGTDYYYDSTGTIKSILLSKRSALTPIPSPTPTFTPTPTLPPIPSSYINSAKEVINALRALNSIVKVGISHQNYPGKLADAKIIIDKFLRENPTDYIPGFNSKISQAMLAYEDALGWWDIKFEGDEVQDFVKDNHYFVIVSVQVVKQDHCPLDKESVYSELSS